MENTGSMQFIEWRVYLQKYKPNEFHRLDSYLNQILLALYKQVNPKKAQRLSASDFQISFKSEKKAPAKAKYSWRASKSAWASFLGVAVEDSDDEVQ